MVPIPAIFAGLILATIGCSLLVVRRLDGSEREWSEILRSRLVMGVPWGTIVVIVLVLGIYLFVQDGVSDWDRPVVIPFRSWSYFYPTGMLTASFSHASPRHLIGNLVGTMVAAPIAEFAWGHYSPRRSAQSNTAQNAQANNTRNAQAIPAYWDNPWIRALVIFPLATVSIGLLTSLFALGPVIGFSGVVFAFAGFAIVRYPVTTLVATTTAQGALLTVYRALDQPILEVVAQPAPPSPPSWATIAIQGHALGFFLGFICAIFVFRRRNYRPNPLRLWVALVLFGFAKSLWAIYWIRGGETYVLFRAAGVIVVTAMALVLVSAITASDRPVLPVTLRRRLSRRDVSNSTRRILDMGLHNDPETTVYRPERIKDIVLGSGSKEGNSREFTDGSTSSSGLSSISRNRMAFVLVIIVLAALAGPAIPFNLFVLDSTDPAGNDSVTIEGYTITYAEGVENELISAIDIAAFGETTTVETSGVIVSNADRNIWIDAVSTSRLAFSGGATIEIGGPGWRESVHVHRTGWNAVGGETAYQIWLEPAGEDKRHVFTSEPTRADVQLAGNNVSIVPYNEEYYIGVESPETESVETVRIPESNETAETNGVTFERDGDTVYANVGDTRVPIATKERYR